MDIGHIIWLLLIGFIMFTLDKKQDNFPVPTVLLLTGIALSFIPYFSTIEITSDLIYNIFLPPLLFISAYQFPPKSFKQNAGIILFLATIGLLMTVAILGGTLFVLGNLFTSFSLLSCFIIASILTPTDPVSVVSILKNSSSDKRIASVVEGESMLNDGTSIVVFTVLANMFVHQSTFSVLNFTEDFLYVSIGGAILGILFGWLMSKGVYYTHHTDYQVMLSIVLAYGIFHLAEFFHVSGVLATVSAGIMLSFEYGKTIKESHFKDALNGFWGIIELAIVSLIFLLIGIEATNYLIFDHWLFAILTFLASIGIRFIIIFSTTRLFPNWRHTDWRTSFIVSWAGLKGTMSIFLILTLYSKQSSNTEIDSIVSISFAVVLLSLIVQSFGIYPLSNKLSSATSK
ncbi:Na(+)/H(+) antiporter NhaG [Paraliobacillus sp. PM-2]|uniref:cation:proton antiporter n=1 Tax=Paraliobacillus sp. PM-2 TaxID=1462524 RepID=UPI00061C5180|nr:sodium:proton antiporter [Paraliobacillus sp. PM-2]CQR47970.1 Na(+)/H(+) antiporter NhaG [Paraliobacillus sp. PM-2]